MTAIDISAWAKLNMWKQPDGEFCVRPGLRKFYSPPANTTIVAAFSIRNDFADEIWHYITTTHATNGVHLLVLDENFDVFQDFAWASDGSPRVVTWGSVDSGVMLGSPDLPTLYGQIGSSLGFASSVPREGGFPTEIPIPSGIVSSFCNRVTLANARTIYFSDPVGSDGGDIRTFVGFNFNQRPGIVYGLHEGANGMLVAVTSEGVYGLDADASAVDIVGSNGTAWRLLSHLSVHSYLSSCVHRGRVYVLTEHGWSPGDTESISEVFLSDPTMPRARGFHITLPDFRRCRMYASDNGPIVAAPQLQAMHMSDLSHEVTSWWRDQTTTPGDLRGVLRDHDGTNMLAMSDGVYLPDGDFDGAVALSGADSNAQPFGTILGTVPGAANENRLPRKVNHAAAVDGTDKIYVAVRGSEHSAAVDADPLGLTVGSSSFGASGRRYTSTPIADAEIDFGDLVDTAPTRDVGIEFTAQGCLVRVSPVPDVKLSDSAKSRAQAKG